MRDSGDRYLRLPSKPAEEIERDRLLETLKTAMVRKANAKRLRG